MPVMRKGPAVAVPDSNVTAGRVDRKTWRIVQSKNTILESKRSCPVHKDHGTRPFYVPYAYPMQAEHLWLHVDQLRASGPSISGLKRGLKQSIATS